MKTPCECRNCLKTYEESKARADWKGYCSMKCQHEKARKLGYRVKKQNVSTGHTEYQILKNAGALGSIKL